MERPTDSGLGPHGEAPFVEHLPSAIAQATRMPWHDSWNFYLLSLGAMLALAGLDLIGSIFAKEWTERQQPWLFLAGLATFVVLFVVYAASLKVAELSIVAIGWFVFLQVGLLLLDRLRYGVMMPTGKWIAIAVVVALQAYLILAPNVKTEAGT